MIETPNGDLRDLVIVRDMLDDLESWNDHETIAAQNAY